ncbi:MAG TPA: triose-phosphate isomerase [Bacteroidota bacterium]|nr:triose-phosphate isomerase [Bacteroidota bacterium]
MRTKIIAGNWKMYKDIAGTSELIGGLTSRIGSSPAGATVVVCPPFTSLALASGLLKGSPIRLGAQNMSQHDDGAYTGEISWNMLRSAGCEYVILGHSERRQYYGEKDEIINLKARKAVAVSLRPIICVGETLAEREQGITDRVVSTQIRGVLSGLSRAEMSNVVIAYEPVWAIGTGKTASPAQAQEVHQMIRKLISQLYDWPTAEATVIQYGGSVKPDNAAELLSQNDIDGALVGGACLKADSFMAIISAAK